MRATMRIFCALAFPFTIQVGLSQELPKGGHQLKRGNGPISDPAFLQKITTTKGLRVAVIDSGIDYNHEKVVGRIWKNKNESDGNLDLDFNGLKGDIFGYDFKYVDRFPFDHISNVPLVLKKQRNEYLEYEANDATNLINVKLGGHGTHVSGIILQNTEASKTFITPLKVAESLKDIYLAIKYCIDNKIKIVNISMGGFLKDFGPQDLMIYKKMISLMVKADKTLFIVAAGNENLDLDDEGLTIVPGGMKYFQGANKGEKLDNLLTVGALNTNEAVLRLADFSNVGLKTVDVYAPGVNISSYWPRVSKEDESKIASGTSMATPFVTAGIVKFLHKYPRFQKDDVLAKEIKLRFLTHTKLEKLKFSKTLPNGTGAVGIQYCFPALIFTENEMEKI